MYRGAACLCTLITSAQVTFTCGPRAKVINATEPATCEYLISFETPYACVDGLFHGLNHIKTPQHGLTLDAERTALEGTDVEAYDRLGDQLFNEELTQKVAMLLTLLPNCALEGYLRKKTELLIDAGVLPAPKKIETNSEPEPQRVPETTQDPLKLCEVERQELNRQVAALNAEILALQTQLAMLSGPANSTELYNGTDVSAANSTDPDIEQVNAADIHET